MYEAGRSRFLLVGDLPPPVNGQATVFSMLVRELPRRGFDCRVVDIARQRETPRSRITLARTLEMGACLVRFASGLLSGYRRVYLLIAQSRAGFWRDLLMIWAAWACGCRTVVHVHGGNYGGFYHAQPAALRFLIRHTLRRVAQIITLSERLRPMFDFDPALAGRVVVVPNAPGHALEGRYRPPREGSPPLRLLFLSNLIQSKGYRDILAALTILKTERSLRPHAVFAGHFRENFDDALPWSACDAHREFDDYVAANALADTVRYVGAVAGEEKYRLLAASDVLLLPTYYVNEGQPVCIIEAMALGCVAVATNYRAIPDLVIDGENGVLIAGRRPDQLALAIEELVRNPQMMRRMSRAAVDRYRRLFTLDRHLDAMVEILASA